jgi:hypothetical protein
MRAAEKDVSHFLDLLLPPMFNRVVQPSTIINDIDFVRRLEHYRDQGRLSSTAMLIACEWHGSYCIRIVLHSKTNTINKFEAEPWDQH